MSHLHNLVTGIVGLPGSGKTRLIAEQFSKGAVVLDDMGDDRTWGKPAWDKNKKLLRFCILSEIRVVIVDVGFCDDKEREKFQLEFPETNWIFYANEPEVCKVNVAVRAKVEERAFSLEEHFKTIDRLTKLYNPPPDARPVYREQS